MKAFQIALVGCGGMANAWVKYALARQDCEFVALVDIKEENAKKMAETYALSCGIYTDLEKALVDSGANLVFDITIPESHRAVTLTALSKGINVLGEKPMASSLEAAKEMVGAVDESGKMYAVMQNRRYLKNIRALRHFVDTGVLGSLGFVTADFFLGPHFGGFRDLMESPLILDMAIHTFDQARFITGADPVSVYCHEFNSAGSWYKGNASAVCIFEMSDGSVFCYRGSWCSEGFATSWESSWRVNGSQGTALWDGHNPPACEVIIPPEEEGFMRQFKKLEAEFSWDGPEGHEGCLNEMFDALTLGRKAETDCTDNIKSMAMVFGAIQSAKEGRKVAITL